MQVTRWSAALVLAYVLAHAGHGTPAAAQGQPSPAADAAFQRGREALQIGKYVEACAAFEESQRLTPQFLTQFNIALCDEQLGKLAAALAIHRELAAHDDNAVRRQKAGELATELARRVPRLRIEIVVGRRGGSTLVPPGLEVTVNGTRITNFRDLPIDLGFSKVVARAPGFREWTGQVNASQEGKGVVTTITLEADPNARSISEPDATVAKANASAGAAPTRDATRSRRKTLGAVGMIAGGAVVAGGIGFGLSARGKWRDAKDACGGSTSCPTSEQFTAGQALADSARTRGNVSTAMVIGGGVLAVGGAVLWFTAPKAERTIGLAPNASSSSLGLSVVGRF